MKFDINSVLTEVNIGLVFCLTDVFDGRRTNIFYIFFINLLLDLILIKEVVDYKVLKGLIISDGNSISFLVVL